MSKASRKPNAKSIDDVAERLSQVVGARSCPHLADGLTDEISEILWAVVDLDPDGEQLLKHSGYVADVAFQELG